MLNLTPELIFCHIFPLKSFFKFSSRAGTFFTLPSGRGLVIAVFFFLFYPLSGRGLVIPMFFPWFFLFFFVVTCPRVLVFARPNKYLPCLLLPRLGNVSCVTLICFTPRREGEQRWGLIPLGLFLFFMVQTSSVCLAKQIIIANFPFTSWACILSDHNIVF